MGNVRVYQNRISKSFMGISSQPSLGGPAYFIRNVMYDIVYQGFKLQRSSVGDVGMHNTVIKSGDAFAVYTSDVFSRALFRNNLFLGGPGGVYNGYDSGGGDVIHLPSADASCSFDYDGFGSIGTGAFAGRIGDATFSSVAEMQSLTTEAHGIEVDLGVFAAAIAYPGDPFAALAAPSFALSASGAAVDKGTPLANVNDGFAGKAPDLGAIEAGQGEPVYGPGGNLGAGGGGTGGGGGAGVGGSGVGGSGGDGAPSSGSGGADGGDDSEGGCTCHLGRGSEGGPAAVLAIALALLGLARRSSASQRAGRR
jgi:hypothetical protein